MDKNVSNMLKSYSQIKSSLQLPLKIKVFLSVLEETITKVKSSLISKDLHRKYSHLIHIFKKQTVEERVSFLFEHAKCFKSLLEEKEESSQSSEGFDQIKEIQTTCKIKEQFVGFNTWEKKGFKLNKKTSRVHIVGTKKQLVFNLRHCFVRHSQKHAKTLIIQSILQENSSKNSQIYIYFDNSILFDEIYNNIFSCIIQNSTKELMNLSNEKEDNEEEMITTTSEPISKTTIILNTKSLNAYFRDKDKILKKIDKQKNRFEELEMKIPNTKVCVDKKKQNRIRIQRTYQLSLQDVIGGISLISQKPDQHLLHFENLQKFSTNISVGYYKFLFNEKVFEFLTIVEENRKPNEYCLFLKGIDNFISEQYIDFICLRVRENANKCKINFMAIVNNKLKKKLTVDFLLTMLDLSLVKQQEQGDKLEEFWTVRSYIDNEEDEEQFEEIGIEDIDEGEEVVNFNKKISTSRVESGIQLNKFQKFVLEPIGPLQNHDKLKDHYLFSQWKIAKNGGVVCTNEAIITEQKKVFKLILAKMGNNLLKHKSIMNFSFPVNVFRKQSHLKTIARNLSYAPIFFDSWQKLSLIDRMKKAAIFQISMNSLGISMEKPFNPILGETYQGTIDGCPIFLQQISHHPPMSSYYLKGRGYTLYGTIQSKASLGLNCAKGCSPHPNFIQFDDGTKIEFYISMMVINGLLFGERSFNFEGTHLVFDRKNKLGARLTYGPLFESFFKKSSTPYDAVTGNIVRVNQWTKDVGECLSKGQKISTIQGLWHSQIKIDQEKVIDFRVDLPPALRDSSQPIQSDSRYRKDLSQLIEGNLELAQQEKDFMEEVQRRDRRLRETFLKQR